MRSSVLILALCAATACTTETTQVSSTETAPTPPPAAAIPAGQDAGLTSLINNFRASQDRQPLTANAALTRAAVGHAEDMVAQGYFSHVGLDGSTVGTRVRAAGCNWAGVAENIASGQTTPDQAMTTWINSPGHRANLLGPYSGFGAARVGTTWVLVFGSGC